MNAEAIIALCALAVAVVSLLLKGRGETKEAAEARGRMEAKLDGVGSDVKDVRDEVKDMRRSEEALGQRVAKVEDSCKNAHHRIDGLEDKFAQAHPPSGGQG